MPKDEENEEETSEDLDESSTSEEEEDESDEDKSEEDESEDEDEPTVPLSALKRERKRRQKAEKRIGTDLDEKTDDPAEPKSKDKEAKQFLKGMMKEVIKEERDAEKKEKEEEEEWWDDVCAKFRELDENFNRKQFEKLMVKYKPTDEDSAWAIWKDFSVKKNDPVNPASKSKHLPPRAKKTTDKTKKSPAYKSGSGKKPWEVVEDAIKEEYGE